MARFPDQLVTDRLILRPPTAADAPGVLAAVTASYPELHRWMPWAKGPYGIEQAREFCAQSQEKLREGVDFTTLLTLREDGTIIGSSGLMGADSAVPSFETGYWLHTGYTRRGYATEAVIALTRLAFESCDAKRVELKIDENNHRSQAVAERLGFELEATLKADSRDNTGAITSTRIYAMFGLASLRRGPEVTIKFPTRPTLRAKDL